MESLFPEQILHSAHRTSDPEQADWFYVPVFDGCALALHHHNRRAYDLFPSGKRYARAMAMQEKALALIRAKYPYWNRTHGRDHLFLAVADEARRGLGGWRGGLCGDARLKGVMLRRAVI